MTTGFLILIQGALIVHLCSNGTFFVTDVHLWFHMVPGFIKKFVAIENVFCEKRLKSVQVQKAKLIFAGQSMQFFLKKNSNLVSIIDNGGIF